MGSAGSGSLGPLAQKDPERDLLEVSLGLASRADPRPSKRRVGAHGCCALGTRRWPRWVCYTAGRPRAQAPTQGFGQVASLPPWTPPYPTLFSRDPNTIFRGNSLTSKCIDETMKLAGMHYLHVTLKPTIEEVRGALLAGQRIPREGQVTQSPQPQAPPKPRTVASVSASLRLPKGIF